MRLIEHLEFALLKARVLLRAFWLFGPTRCIAFDAERCKRGSAPAETPDGRLERKLEC
jgi:hypothetical protein